MVGQLQAAGKIDRQIHPAVFLTMIIGPIHYWLRYRDRFKDAMHYLRARTNGPDLCGSMDCSYQKYRNKFSS
jgi:hypothetical protein